MKKTILIIFNLLIATCVTQAQDYTCDSLLARVDSPYEEVNINFTNSFNTNMRDGSILTCIPTKSLINHQYVDYGDWFYKTDPQNLCVIDSTFVEADLDFGEDCKHVLLAPDPRNDGYILAKLVYSDKISSDCKSWLRINHIDDALNIQAHGDALMVPLDSTYIQSLNSIWLEGESIMLMYIKDYFYTPIVARISLDGTILGRNEFDSLFTFGEWHGMGVFSDMPKEYALYDWIDNTSDTCIVLHVLDSLLNLTETITLNSHEGDVYMVQPGISPVLSIQPFGIFPLDDGSFIEYYRYMRHNLTRNGACLMKVDKNTHECLASVQFESFPVYTNPNRMGYPIGIGKADDGNIYFAYRTNNNDNSTVGWIGIAKLDPDLNILWQRYCFGSWSAATGYYHYYCSMGLTEKGFMIGGKIQKNGVPYNFFQFFINDNGTNGTPEMDKYIRPYAFYPNPVQDRLHLQYSPDVQPACIELFDLQGRLVSKQSQGLDNIELQGLAPGQYVMKVTMEDGKTFTDKVVKE